jgi:hypothetical protein
MTPRAGRRGAKSRDDGDQDGQTVPLAPCRRPVPGTYEVNGRSTPGPPPDNRVSRTAVLAELEPGHHPPATQPPPPPRREDRNKLKPTTAFRITAGRMQLRRSRPGAVGDLDPDDAVPGHHRDRDRLPGSTRAGVPDRITKDLAHQQDRHIPARVPGAEYLRDERAGSPRPLRPPGKRHALPDRNPGHHRTRPSPAAPPGKPAGQRADAGTCTLTSAANVKPAHGPPRILSVVRPWSRPPSVAVRAKPTVPRTAPRSRFSSAMCPWTPQRSALQRYKVTHTGTEKKRPA